MNIKQKTKKPLKLEKTITKYERMLAGMQRNQKKSRKKPSDPWFLYMLRCENQALYTGIAKDIEKRFKAHKSGKGARYTRMHPPLEIVYREACASRTDALVREFKIKKLSPKRKQGLVEAYRTSGGSVMKAVRAIKKIKKK